ncbi:MAG: excinuclease ABC subunit UvrA [Prevotellaceae bacterium]|jgi:excinuclease ABC subunit A|nr:excinuclease ABC subunit UvrA [Prevotellaceae bacterium]
MEETKIEVVGARVHNLKNISVTIPRNALTVITGLSGSGKSSLAFDTIYAEGQRRYLETLSSYARQFLGNMERPDVEQITGLSPVISIEQKTTSRNPRSTVGTTTEIYDFLRLLFARASIAYSKNTGEQMVRYTDEQIVDLIIEKFAGQKLLVLAPIVKGRKGHYKDLFEQLGRKGYLNVRVDGEVREIHPMMKLDRYKAHFVELVVDKLIPGAGANNRKRLRNAIATAMQQGNGTMLALNAKTDETRFYSRFLMCPTTGIAYSEPAPHSFSFNSPQGACPRCNGLGVVSEADVDKIIPDRKKSIHSGGIAPLGAEKGNLLFLQLEAIAKKFGFSLSDPIESIPAEGLEAVLYGTQEGFRVDGSKIGGASNYYLSFEGVISIIANRHDRDDEQAQSWANKYVSQKTCPACYGSRLKEDALFFKVADKNIAELADMDIESLAVWFAELDPHLSDKQRAIASEIVKEISSRLSFLMDVGLGYLSLSRSSVTLSGGESQRIRLATQVGSKLVNVLYILDEPSIGLHQRDNIRLIESLKKLRDEGNSVIVVEHDEEMMRAADWVIDVGPGAGMSGGKIVFQGKIGETVGSDSDSSASLTMQYLRGEKKIPIPERRREGSGRSIVLDGATGNNLKNVTLTLPLGMFVCITGVSGSGKSSLINETLHPILSRTLYRSLQTPLPYREITGAANIDKVVEVDQSPIGRTPRSNPATFTGVFGEIRKLFESTPDAKIRGYKAGRFSFNVKGGRCEECRGAGVQSIEMNFLPDVYVTCKACNGKRYNRETLAVRYKGKNISDVLEMTISQALDFFENIPAIVRNLKAMQDVGLGYVALGQPGTTLSGGESQRVKLAAELAKRDTGKTLYIFDEPTTGLHFEDVRVLLDVLNQLVDRGNTVVVIEHNMDVVKVADYIIDLGPEGGAGGGRILCAGTPEEICKNKESYTAQQLAKVI